MLEAVLHGVILAFGLILPLGVQNIFVFNQGALQRRFTGAVPVIVTAALCDTLLILAAVGGVSLVVLSVSWVSTVIYTAGFFFLAYMGWQIWTSVPKAEGPQALPVSRQIGYAISVSLLNPHALLDTVGVIGTSSLKYPVGERWAFAAAAAAVSWLWFAGLAGAGRLAGRADPGGKALRLLNRVSALIVWGLAGWMGIEGLQRYL